MWGGRGRGGDASLTSAPAAAGSGVFAADCSSPPDSESLRTLCPKPVCERGPQSDGPRTPLWMGPPVMAWFRYMSYVSKS